MITERKHYHPGHCFEGSEVCRLEEESDRHREYWRQLANGSVTKVTDPSEGDPSDCYHRDPWNGNSVQCGTCPNGRRIKLYYCRKFDISCTLKSSSIEGTTTCDGCKSKSVFPPNLKRVNLGAGGLGDTLMSLGVMTAFAQRSSTLTSLGINPLWADFARLFALPFALHSHVHDLNLPLNPDRSQLQMNCGYQLETLMLGNRCGVPRHERYARNIGSTGFALPSLVDLQGHIERGRHWRGCVVLAPFGSHAHRDWRIEHWQTLERILQERGYRTVVFHRELPPGLTLNASPAPVELLKSERAIGLDARSAVDLFVNANFVIGNDSGPAHLGGILRRPTIVLCGQVRGEDIYSCYPTVFAVNGNLDCGGCYWNEPNVGGPYNPARCLHSCANLQSISSIQVANLVDQVSLPMATLGKTILCWQRLQTLRSEAIAARSRPGDMAEAGCFNGGGALLISTFAAESTVHLFDALGLPEDDAHPSGIHRRGEFAGKSEEIQSLPWKSKVRFHWGRIPETFDGLEALRFSLVHLDMDTLQATSDALEWFWPRLVRGGVIVLDDVDWHHCPGVRQALNNVLPDVPVEKPHPTQGVIRRR